MKADDRNRLEGNALAEGAAALVGRAKSGALVPPKVLGAVLLVLLLGGVWYYVSTTGRSAASATWAKFADLVRTAGPSDLEQFANANPQDTAGRLARLEVARLKLGTDGLAKLPVLDVEQRNKAVAAIEAARGDLLALADEFRGDKTLQAACLLDAAEAELSLVGIPKTLGGTDYRGTVGETVSLLRRAADVVGTTTPAGEGILKRAADLEANKAQVEELGSRLTTRLTPPPSLVPGGGALGNPVPAPAPPAGILPPAAGTPPTPR